MKRSLSATGRTRAALSKRQFAPRNRPKRSTDSAVRSGGFTKGVKQSSVGSVHTQGSGATGTSAGPLGWPYGFRASTRSCSATTLRLVAGWRERSACSETSLPASSRVGLTSRVRKARASRQRLRCTPRRHSTRRSRQVILTWSCVRSPSWDSREFPRERTTKAWHSSMRRWPGPRVVSRRASRLLRTSAAS